MLNVELLPWLLEVQLLIGNFRADRLVYKVISRQWHPLVCPLLQNIDRNGHKFRANVKGVEQLFDVADTCRQYQDVMGAVVEHALDVSDQIHSVLADVIQASNKWRNVGW